MNLRELLPDSLHGAYCGADWTLEEKKGVLLLRNYQATEGIDLIFKVSREGDTILLSQDMRWRDGGKHLRTLKRNRARDGLLFNVGEANRARAKAKIARMLNAIWLEVFD